MRTIGVEPAVVAGDQHPRVDRSRLEGCIDELYVYGDALDETAVKKLFNIR
jgi:hypothetical protein